MQAQPPAGPSPAHPGPAAGSPSAWYPSPGKLGSPQPTSKGQASKVAPILGSSCRPAARMVSSRHSCCTSSSSSSGGYAWPDQPSERLSGWPVDVRASGLPEQLQQDPEERKPLHQEVVRGSAWGGNPNESGAQPSSEGLGLQQVSKPWLAQMRRALGPQCQAQEPSR